MKVIAIVLTLVMFVSQIAFVALVTLDSTNSDPIDDAPAVRSEAVAVYHPERVTLGNASNYSPPDFTSYSSTQEKKEAFYRYLLPLIHKANLEVVKERLWLTAMADTLLNNVSLSQQQLNELEKFEKRYRRKSKDLDTAERVGALLLRVDVVPASLVVAQAAKESGWGTSRFAIEGNNYFGIWCFYEGCGLTPLRRDNNRAHEVATFGSVEQGVRYYVRTINTHTAYNDLRKVRANAKRVKQSVEGEKLADGLIRYSERGLPYVKEIQSMIRFNKMQRFTRNYSV
ncbi:MAG: Bax protein [Candidatus Azotimanducaceae bacterium]|jgi:Bax protein